MSFQFQSIKNTRKFYKIIFRKTLNRTTLNHINPPIFDLFLTSKTWLLQVDDERVVLDELDTDLQSDPQRKMGESDHQKGEFFAKMPGDSCKIHHPEKNRAWKHVGS